MPEGYQLQYDEQNRPYFQLPGQPRRYVSPVAMGERPPEDKTGMFRSRPQWNARTGKFETPFDWGNLATMATIGALTGGAANAFMAGPAAASSGLPSYMAAPGVPYGVNAGVGGVASGLVPPAVTGGGGVMKVLKNIGKSSWLHDALFAGLPAIAGLFGTKMASNASKRAAQIQADAYRDALKQTREMYDIDRADFQPYLTAGHAAVTRMGDLLANSSPPPLPASVQRRLTGQGDTYTPSIDQRTGERVPAPRTMADLARPVGAGQTPAANVAPPIPASVVSPPGPPVSTKMPVPLRIRVQAPDGEIRELPEPQALKAMQLGARRVS